MDFPINEMADGLIKTPVVTVPENAAYAVPTVYKDATEGTMTVKSLLFRAMDCK